MRFAGRGDLNQAELGPERVFAKKFRVDGHIVAPRQTITDRLEFRRAGDRFDFGQTVEHVLAVVKNQMAKPG